MAKLKRFLFTWPESGLTVYGFITQESTGLKLDETDGVFRSSPTDPYCNFIEDATIKGRYVYETEQTTWKNGWYAITAYRQTGAVPSPETDRRIAAGAAYIENDRVVTGGVQVGTGDFLSDVVADIGRTYEIKDSQGHFKENDPVVTMCVKLAYQQIMSATNTSFHKAARTVVYEAVSGPLFLMHQPVDVGQDVTVSIDGEALTMDTDFVIQDGYLVLGNVFTLTTCYGRGYYFKTGLTAGYNFASEHDLLYAALMFQGTANYNVRDLLGFTQVTGERGTTRTISTKGGLIDAVRDIITPLVYRGSGRVCS